MEIVFNLLTVEEEKGYHVEKIKNRANILINCKIQIENFSYIFILLIKFVSFLIFSSSCYYSCIFLFFYSCQRLYKNLFRNLIDLYFLYVIEEWVYP